MVFGGVAATKIWARLGLDGFATTKTLGTTLARQANAIHAWGVRAAAIKMSVRLGAVLSPSIFLLASLRWPTL